MFIKKKSFLLLTFTFNGWLANAWVGIFAIFNVAKSYKYIRIGLATQVDPIDINLKDIQYTIVSSNMKKMIEIYREYKKSGKNKYDEFDRDFLLKKRLKAMLYLIMILLINAFLMKNLILFYMLKEHKISK